MVGWIVRVTTEEIGVCQDAAGCDLQCNVACSGKKRSSIRWRASCLASALHWFTDLWPWPREREIAYNYQRRIQLIGILIYYYNTFASILISYLSLLLDHIHHTSIHEMPSYISTDVQHVCTVCSPIKDDFFRLSISSYREPVAVCYSPLGLGT